MNILQILTLGLYKPFNHDPKDFKLKVVSSWFSEDYVSFKYTANGGRSWKTIRCAHEPFLGTMDDNWEWSALAYKLSPGSTFEYEKRQWETYQGVLNYEAKEWKKYLDGWEKQERRRREYVENRRKQLSALNQ
jgi:hypothetical protein